MCANSGDNMLNLRPYQEKTLEELRKGFLAGKRVQILYAPTGAGKTEMAIALMAATKDKGNKAAMLLDRIVLCDQTSGRLERYNIDHGVMQSGHWRYRPYENIQVCSAQTLERRGTFPGLNLLIVDECHQTRSQTVEFIKNNPDIRVIGLTATPFTKGLGQVYENVISTVTTQELVEDKVLVPLRVFIAKEIDMTGAKKVAGEWSNAEATTRGKKITGDVVDEWIKKTHEIFGEPRKTIVFAAGVEHGADLAKKFQEHGHNFICISYKDDDEWKKQVIEDFSKSDTDIVGLIATDILTKGFDVPDVMIGISARPFSKSLSSHIQQMGRVMRGCEGKEYALWLDHSGNYLRFRKEWEEVYADGVHELDEGKEKVKPELTEKEKKESKCPSCHVLWSGGDTCYNCGYIRERVNKVIDVAGQLEELSGAMGHGNKQEFWSMMQYYVKYKGWSKGRAANTYKDKFGVWPRLLDDSKVTLPTKEVEKFVQKKLYAFLKKTGRK
jgi:superfamily II DNA or RNA helicase